MGENVISYILQIATIVITLTLGLISVYQTRKLQSEQNIISVTTDYRLKRVEQLREFSRCLLANTNPLLMKLEDDTIKMLQDAANASEAISIILHRYFDADRELMELANNIVQLALAYHNSNKNCERTYHELIYKRDLFKIKCDMYTTADWNRIKRETKGVNTSAESWIDYYERIEKGFEDELNKIKARYNDSIRNIPVDSGR